MVRVVVEFDRMPDFKVEQALDGTVTVAFADKAFDRWDAGATRPAAASRPDGIPADERAADPERTGTDREPASRALPQQDTSRFDVTWDKTPIEDALNQLARALGHARSCRASR